MRAPTLTAFLAASSIAALASCSDSNSAADSAASEEPEPQMAESEVPEAAMPADIDPEAELSASGFTLYLPVLPGRPGALYGTIQGGAEPDRLTGIAIGVPGTRTEVHETLMTDDRMRMEARDALEIPPGMAVKFEEGGLHGMVYDIPAEIEAGTSVPVTLSFQTAGTRTVDAPVEARGMKLQGMASMDHGD